MDWRFIPEERLDGVRAMALDEVAAQTVQDGGPATVRLYRWIPSTLTLGYGTAIDEIDMDFCAQNDITVTRRPTGGGAIYHDSFGDVAYSIIAPADAFPSDVSACYREFCEPIFAAFRDVGVAVDFAPSPIQALHQPACYLRALDPAHDMTGPDGRKIAGNAQYRMRDAIIQHGSLTFAVDASTHVGCFSAPLEESQFRSRVSGVREYVDIERATFVAALSEQLHEWAGAKEGSWSEAEEAASDQLVADKYTAESWVYKQPGER